MDAHNPNLVGSVAAAPSPEVKAIAERIRITRLEVSDDEPELARGVSDDEPKLARGARGGGHGSRFEEIFEAARALEPGVGHVAVKLESFWPDLFAKLGTERGAERALANLRVTSKRQGGLAPQEFKVHMKADGLTASIQRV